MPYAWKVCGDLDRNENPDEHFHGKPNRPTQNGSAPRIIPINMALVNRIALGVSPLWHSRGFVDLMLTGD